MNNYLVNTKLLFQKNNHISTIHAVNSLEFQKMLQFLLNVLRQFVLLKLNMN